MWTWTISKGTMTNETLTFEGYSGNAGSACNNPECVSDIGRGPLPPGLYGIGRAMDGKKLGPFVLPLTPEPQNEMFGRSGFYIHGDNIQAPGHASDGCIVLPFAARLAIAKSEDFKLQVIP